MPVYSLELPDVPKQIFPARFRLGGPNPRGDRFGMTNYYLEFNGRPYFGISGEFHYSRYPFREWDEALLQMKLAGIGIVATYVFWIHHEEEEGCFDWNGDNNLRYFVDLCAKHDLRVILRIGPFAHGECRNGGLPDWLYGRPFEVRSNDPGYLFYARRLYAEIGRQVAGQLFKDGGPIIGIQLENEYMHAAAPWELTAGQGDEFLSGGRDGAAICGCCGNWRGSAAWSRPSIPAPAGAARRCWRERSCPCTGDTPSPPGTSGRTARSRSRPMSISSKTTTTPGRAAMASTRPIPPKPILTPAARWVAGCNAGTRRVLWSRPPA